MSTPTPWAGRRCAPLRRVVPWAAALMAGCSRGPEYGAVEGTVRFGRTPLAAVEVRFLPDPEAGSDGPEASAYTDAQGGFRLRTARTGRAGAAVGTYRVCLADPARRPVGPPKAAATAHVKAPRVPPRYGDPATTPLRGVAVRPGRQSYDLDVQRGTVAAEP